MFWSTSPISEQAVHAGVGLRTFVSSLAAISVDHEAGGARRSFKRVPWMSLVGGLGAREAQTDCFSVSSGAVTWLSWLTDPSASAIATMQVRSWAQGGDAANGRKTALAYVV